MLLYKHPATHPLQLPDFSCIEEPDNILFYKYFHINSQIPVLLLPVQVEQPLYNQYSFLLFPSFFFL